MTPAVTQYTIDVLRPANQVVLAASPAAAMAAVYQAVPGCVVRGITTGNSAPLHARKVYIAGPMTGLPEFNYPAFMAAADAVRSFGMVAVNPAELNPDTTVGYAECMKTDIRALIECDAIMFLPGWALSVGATLEKAIADVLKITAFRLDELALFAASVPPAGAPIHAA